MFADFNALDGHRESDRGRARHAFGGRALEREVPIGPVGLIPAAVHAWLDGETALAAARRADTSHQVDFWTRLDADISRRRQIRTPVYLKQRVMDSLPRGIPPFALTPWYRRPLALPPLVLLVAGAALLALGAALGAALGVSLLSPG